MIRNSIFAFIFLVSIHTRAQQNIEYFVKCVSFFESKVIGQTSSQAKVNREVGEAFRLPSINSSVGPQGDLINKNYYPLSTDWNVTVTQNIYSRSFSKNIAALDESVKSASEQEKAQLTQAALDKLDLLFQYISAIENLKIVNRQIDRQTKITQLLRELTKARINDGSYMLSAESDLTLLNNRKREVGLSLSYIEKSLHELPFFNPQIFQDDSLKSPFFSFTNEVAPLDAPSRPEIISLDRKAKSDRYSLQSEESQWYPRLDLSVAYSATPQNAGLGVPSTQLMTGLTLSIPISESYTHNSRRSFYRSEISRNEILRDRQAYLIDAEVSFEKNSIADIKKALEGLNESLNLLSQSREISIKKFSLNKLSYFELSNLDDRIDQTSRSIVSKKIEMWHILSKWYLQKITQKTDFESTACNK